MNPDRMRQRLMARIGTTINAKYRVDDLLGIGGMAAVYAATHRNGGRVALKVLHVELSRMQDVRARFLREGYVANKIGHAGVVRIIDDDVDADGSVYLVMDLLEGQTLEAYRVARGGRLAIDEAIRLVMDVLDVLANAHAQRIVHRDIKPDNVFLTTEGKTKLMDFGIARMLDASVATGAGALMGTPAFMSPEQASGRNEEIDARSDVWSVGALLFFLLSGEEVHPARTSTEQLIYAGASPARTIGSVVPMLPSDIAHVIDVALAFDRRDRWQTAAAMRNALKFASGRAGIVREDSGISRVSSAGPITPLSSGSATLIHGSDDSAVRRLSEIPGGTKPSPK